MFMVFLVPMIKDSLKFKFCYSFYTIYQLAVKFSIPAIKY